MPTGILKCQITQIWHFSKAFGSEKLALAYFWHYFYYFGSEIFRLAVTVRFGIF